MPDQVSFAKGSTKPTSGITTGRLYVVDSSTTDKSDLYLGKDATHLIQIGATVAQGAKADSSVQSVKVGSTSYSPSSGVVSLPAYPTTLPASDVYAWAKAATKPSYNLDEVPDGSNRKLSRYVPYNGVLMPTNPFGGKMLYINSIDNAFASAPKRYYVTGTVHLKTVNGVNYPYEDTSKAVTDDNYWVDSPVVSMLTSAQCQSLFDGSYEGGYTIPVGHYLKLRIMFGTNTSPSGSTSYFPGYPYGSYYLSYYYTGVPSSTEAHIYNKYAAHTVGWHKYQATYFAGSSESGSNVIQQISDGGDYQRTCVDFIIKSPDSGTATTITEVDYQLSRPSLSRDGSTVTKYGNQVLYHSFLWNNGTENGGTNTVQIDPNGTITAISFKENGTTLSNKYLALTGGTITSTSSTDTPLIIKSVSNNNSCYLGFKNNSTNLGYIGVIDSRGPVYYDSAVHELAYRSEIPTTYVSTVNGASGAITNVAKTDAVNTWTSTQGIKTTSVPALELKNTSSSGGAFIDYENNNQTTNYWRSGMASSGTFAFLYNGTSKVEISTSGGITANGDVILYTASGNSPRLTFQRGTLTDTQNDWSIYDSSGLLYIQQRGNGSTGWENRATFTQSYADFAGYIIEGGTSLANKYGRLASANTWTGVNTFTASDFYVTASNDVSISGNSGQNIISTDNGTDVIVGDTATDTTYIYGGVVDLNSSAVTVGSSSSGSVSINGATTVSGSISWASDPSNNNHLTRKSYVDSNFVDKSTNQTGIAGNKTWTGNQTWSGSVTQTISNATNYSTQYYDAQYRYSSGNLNSTTSIQRNPNSVSTSVSSSRTISSTGLSDSSSADFYISGGYTTSTTTMATPRISFHTFSEGSASSSSPYVYYDGWVVLSNSGNSNSSKYFSVSHELDVSETQHNLKYDAEGRFSLDYDYMWGEETAHMEIVPQNGAFYIGDPYTYGIASIESIVNAAATCFRGDTSYITMADGSKKLIKDVEVGDIVKGYDVNKKEYTEAVVLQNVKTGEERAFDCYVMDDGTTVDIFNNDGFICSLDLHRKDKYGDKDGDYLNVYSMKSLYSFHEKKDDQRKIIKEEGNLENTTCVIHKFTADCAKRTPRYTLYTSNGTFFVNGLLHGLAARSLPQYFKTFRINTPDYIDIIFDSILADLAERDESLPDTHIENPDKAEDLATLNRAKATIAWAKNKLSESDYKAMKYAEGALSEEEWLPIKAQRAEYRQTVNDNELIVTEYTEKVMKDNPAMLDAKEVPEHIARHAKWIKHQKTYDDNYELFKKWALSRKEERQKRIEESKERSRLRAEEIKANKSSQKNEDK